MALKYCELSVCWYCLGLHLDVSVGGNVHTQYLWNNRMWHGKPDFPKRKSGFLRGGTRGVVVARVAGHSAIVP